MYYYGDRSCICHPSEDIGIKYFSSSTLKLFIQDQKENHNDYKYKIVKIYETCREDAKQLEVDLHKRFDVKNHTKFINRANQSSEGFDTTGLNFTFTENHKQRISTDQSKNNSFKGKIHTQAVKNRISVAQTGSKKSKETKNKISQSLKGRIKSPEHIEKFRLSQLGKISSEESKNKQSKTMKAQFDPKKHNSSKHIIIFNKDGKIMFDCYGNFKKVCIDNNLNTNTYKIKTDKKRYFYFNTTTRYKKNCRRK